MSTEPPDDRILAAWRALLTELGELGDVLCNAIEQDDVMTAIGAAMQMRRVRSALARADVALEAGDLSEQARAIGEVARLAINARGAELAMEQWLARPLPGDRELLATPVGTAVLADVILPPVWDFETDLVVLVGEGIANVGQILVDLGQRRLVTLGHHGIGPGTITVESIDELTTAIRTLVPNPPAQFVLRASVDAPRELVDAAAEATRATLSDLRIHRNTLHAFSRTWFEQGAANLPALARCASVAALDGAFTGVPMVIVAPGPSLAKNVDQLRAVKGRAIITAFSHSLKPVLAAGVVPDLVVTVDPQDVRYHFADCDLSRTCLVNGATVHPALFELPAHRFLALSANCAIDDWIFDGLAEEALVPGGGSVATTAFSLGLRWRCDPIVFVGLDLSFPNGEYYVASSSDGDARAELHDGVVRVAGWSREFVAMKERGGPAAPTERAIELPGWAGGTVSSTFMFGLFHRWFVERLQHTTDVTVYNCTEGGAYVDGMRHVPLAHVRFDREIDVAARIDLAHHAAIDAARTERLARHIGGFVVGLRRCRGLARRGQQLISDGETGAALDRVERALAKALRPLGFASLLAQHEIDRANDRARRPASRQEYLSVSSGLFATLETVIGELEPTLASASNRLGRQP